MNIKKILTCLFILYIAVSQFQCSYPDECVQLDWIGIYTFESSNSSICTDAQGNPIVFPEEIVIEPGSNSNKIILNGVEAEFNECFVDGSFGNMSIEYNEFRLIQKGCSAQYSKS